MVENNIKNTPLKKWSDDNKEFIDLYMIELKKKYYIIKKTPNRKTNQKKYIKTEKGKQAHQRACKSYYQKNKEKYKEKYLEKKLKLKKITET